MLKPINTYLDQAVNEIRFGHAQVVTHALQIEFQRVSHSGLDLGGSFFSCHGSGKCGLLKGGHLGLLLAWCGCGVCVNIQKRGRMHGFDVVHSGFWYSLHLPSAYAWHANVKESCYLCGSAEGINNFCGVRVHGINY